jgi:erythromycin esterase-like protein
MGVGTIREPLLPAIRDEIAKGSRLIARTAVSAVRLDGDQAVAMVRREAQDPRADTARSVVTSHRDTWVHDSGAWRWRESIEVSYHWVLPPTGADAARAVAAELKTRAVPMSGADGLAAFGAAVGDARLVALGESARGTREFTQSKQRMVEYLAAQKGFTVLIAAKDPDVQALADRLHLTYVQLDAVTADSVSRAANGSANLPAKAVLWTDNAHARDPRLRDKFGRRLYAAGFTFDRGEVRAVGVENGESRGLGVYTAQASPEGSGDAVLAAAGMPEFFLNMTKLPYGGALSSWLANLHLFHDLGAYWVLDDPDASLQPEELSNSYDGLYFVMELHSAG